MSTPNQYEPQDDLSMVFRKIQEIVAKSADGDYIYRGEPEHYKQPPYCGKVSSNLWRELEAIKVQCPDIKAIQTEIVAAAKAYTDKTNDFEILTDIQHYGGKTNLIDFTTNYNIALFFACYGSPGKDGRVIILQETEEIKKMLRYPQEPENRVCAQKSVFVEPPKGYIEQRYEVICIPKDLKLRILKHLRADHCIDPITIYNDIHGFIKSQKDNWMAYRGFYSGLISQNKANQAKTLKEKRKACEEAIEHYTNALEPNLQLLEVYNNRGVAYRDKGDYELAIEDLNKAIELKPDDAGAYNNRGLAYGSKCEYELAIEDFDKAIELNPNYAQPYNNRGAAYVKKGDYELAIVDLNKAIELNPNSAESYNNRGHAYSDKGDYDRAIEDYDKAIELKPDFADAYLNRSTTYGRKGKYDCVIADCNKAIELKPDFAEPYSNRGSAYSSKCDYDRAIVDCNKAIELKPNFADAYNKRGFAYGGKCDYDRAIADFDKAIELKPDYIDVYFNRGNAYSGKCDYDRAIADYDKAIELKPDYAKVYYNRGVAYGTKGKIDSAIEDYSKAIELKPKLFHPYYNRGHAYYQKDEICRAIEDYSKTIELEPELAEAYYNRGEAWLHLEQWENAKSDLTTAKSMGINLLIAFDYLYESVQDFEQTNGVKVPEDIATLFSPEVVAMRKAELEQQMVEQAEQLSTEQLETVIGYMTGLREQEEWEATRELEGDPKIAKSLERAEADVKAGRLKSWDEVRRNV